MRRIRDLNRLRIRFQGYYNRFRALCMIRTDLIWWKMILRRIRDLTRRWIRRSTGNRTRILKRTIITAVSPVAQNMMSGTINLWKRISILFWW